MAKKSLKTLGLSVALAITTLPTLSFILPNVTPSAQASGLTDLFDNSDDNAGASKGKFLPVDKAFKVLATSKQQKDKAVLNVQFDITPQHYVYRDKIKLSLPKGVSATPLKFNQSAQFVDDPQFGKVAVFDQNSVTATTTLTNTNQTSIDNAGVTVNWQGCAKAGLCYPPEKVSTTVTLAANTKASTKANTQKDDKATTTTQSQATPAEVTKNATKNKDVENNTATPVAKSANANKANSSFDSANNATVSDPINATNKALDNKASTKSIDDENSVAINTENTIVEDGIVEDGIGNESGDESSNTIATSDSTTGVNANGIEEGYVNTTALPTTENTANANNLTKQDTGLDNKDPFGLGTHPWLALLLLFLAGLGLAFTPCVLPMLPIVANIVAKQNNPTPKKAAILTASYAFGVATAYGILGALIAVFGQSLGIIGWLQNPIILLSFAAVFVVLALYMLELVPLRLPASISNKLNRVSDKGHSKLGSTSGSFVAGFLSALVVSPCVSAPLFGALLAVSTIGNPVLGFAALFMLGFGLSAPLIIVGATQGSIMPKAGMWMNWIKQGFALLLFAVALLLIERVFISSLMLLVWALWFLVVATWAWYWQGRGQMLTKALGLLTGVWAATLIVGAALGNTDSLQPLATLGTGNGLINERAVNELADGAVLDNSADSSADNSVNSSFNKTAAYSRVTTLAQVDDIIANHNKVLVDVTAEWCIECRIMDKNLFASPPSQMTGWQVVKLDITDTNEDSKAILSRYQLFGPPALLYYKNGKLMAQQVGETKRDDFIAILSQLN